MLQGGIAFLSHGIELEDAVEVHQLDTCDVIDLPARDDMLQIVVHRLKSNRIAIGARVS